MSANRGWTVVVGGTRGIGRAVAERAAAGGAPTLLTGTDAAGAGRVAAAVAGSPGAAEVVGLPCDVGVRGSVDALRADLDDRGIEIASLVLAAGVFLRRPVAELAAEEWDRILAINLTGTFAVIQALLPRLVAGDASIVIVSSQAAVRGGDGVSAYAATKAGQLGLMRALAGELAPAVRVNAVCPGFVDTEMLHGSASGTGMAAAGRLQHLADLTPLRRLQTAESIAEVVHFLAGPAARDITGQAVQVSGGLVLT